MSGVTGMIADGDSGAALALFYGHVQVHPRRRLLLGVVILYAEGVDNGSAVIASMRHTDEQSAVLVLFDAHIRNGAERPIQVQQEQISFGTQRPVLPFRNHMAAVRMMPNGLDPPTRRFRFQDARGAR